MGLTSTAHSKITPPRGLCADAKRLAVSDRAIVAQRDATLAQLGGSRRPSRDGVISHPLSPRFSPCLLRTHPSHPRSRDAKAALTHFSPWRHPPNYWPHLSHTPDGHADQSTGLA
ncbi:hypothetical protein N7454_003250 [Penicillium verhagenii]|nr:hypothetical protein N7454_003250 [Penicillium verhagenii]